MTGTATSTPLPAADAPTTTQVYTADGPVRGSRVPGTENVRVYKGIPYAAAPVGPLRWKPPQPVRPWKTLRDCTRFAAQAPRLGPTGYRITVRVLFPDIADKLLELYPPPEEPDADARQVLLRLVTVAAFAESARLTARFAVRSRVPVYMYQFTRVAPPLKTAGLGATHGIEIPYVFQTLPGAFGAAIDTELAAAMNAYWSSFARNGDPNGDNRIHWSRYTRDKEACLIFGDTIRHGQVPYRKACDLLEPEVCRKHGVPPP